MHQTRNSLYPVTPEFESRVDSRCEYLSAVATTIRPILLFELDLILRNNNVFLILQFLGLSFVRLSWKSLFLISTFPHKLIFSLWAWSAHGFARCSCSRWDSSCRWVSYRAISELCCSHFLISISASASVNFSELHSLLERLCVPRFYEIASFSPRTALRSKVLWR